MPRRPTAWQRIGRFADVRRLIAIALPGGTTLVDAIRRAWDDGDAVAPIDPRATAAVRAAALAALRPHLLLDESGVTPLPTPLPIEDGDATVLLTSGTSGSPRAVVHDHDAIEAAAFASAVALGVEVDLRWLACLPLHHVGGFGVIARALTTGAALEVHDGFDAAAVNTAAAAGATHVSLVTTALRRIDASRWHRILLGGSAIPADRPANTVATYGMTETFGGVVYDGLPLPGNEVEIAEGGELLVRSPALGRRFRDGSGLIGADGWFHTGDLGAFDAATGFVSVHGRGGDVINTGGEKVWPADVERALEAHPAVREVAVVGRDDPEWGQRVVAVVVPADPAAPPSLAELRAAARDRLPSPAAPKELVVVASLPRTSLGKIRRDELARDLRLRTEPQGGPDDGTAR